MSDDAVSEAGRLFRLAALNTEYASCIDADRLEEWPGLFLEDGRYRITTRAMLHDRVSSLREANIYERQTYRHIVGMPALRGATAGDIAAETPFVVVRTMRDGRMDLFAAGVYLDRVRADADGRLRFAERLVVCDSSRFDTLLAIPL
jgi:anthranilate 1,2-dioxygenase small subunit/terephthalate 1,2-dioxygenase oxygenase component beta subunit